MSRVIITKYYQRNYRMSTGILKICVLAVSLKLKFKCRMRVEWKDGLSTQQTAISDGLFKFDEVLSLHLQQGAAQLNIALITEKGSLYSGGKVKLDTKELKHSVGQIVQLPILKCIDRQACMQTKILWISQNQDADKNKKDISFNQKRPFHLQIQTPEKNVRENLVINDNYGQTKSEYGFQIPLNSPPFQLEKNKIGPITKRGFYGKYSIQRSSRQPRDPSPQRSTRRDSPQQDRQDANQTSKRADYSASKLKSVQLKYKQQQQKVNMQRQKRKSLQDAEQSYKMQIIRLKLNKQQSERQLAKKTNTIKELSTVNNTLKDADKKASILKQQLRKRQQEVNCLSEQILNLNQQLSDIKKSAQYQINRTTLQYNQLKKQNEYLRKNQNTSIEELKMIISKKEEEINCADLKRNQLEQDLQKQRKMKAQLEIKTNQQIIQLEKNVNLLKKQLKTLSEQLNTTKNISQKQKLQLTQMTNSHKQQISKERINSAKIQLQKNNLQEQLSESQQQLRETKKYKEKYQQQIDKYKSTKEEYLWIKRKFEVAVEQNYKLEERLKICLEQNQIYIEQINDFIEKQRMCEGKISQYQQELHQNKVLVQKHKKNQENHQKDSLSNQQKQRQFKNQLNKKQIEINKLHSEIESLNIKLAQMKQTIKFQTSKKTKTHNSIQQQWEDSKLKTIVENQKFLEIEIMNQKQNYTELQMQYVKTKEELQKCTKNEIDWIEQERIWQSQKQKYFTENNKLMKQIKENAKKSGEQQAKIYSLGQRLQKYIKLSKQQEQKILILQINLKKINQQKENIMVNYNQQVQNCKASTNEILVIKQQNKYIENQKEKFSQISENLSMQNKKIKEEIFIISKRLKQQQDKYLSEIKKIKQEFNKSETRALNFRKQADTFKQNLRNILVNSIISKIPRNQQEYELLLKKKEQKLGLTLTNELLIRLEDYLKQLHRHQLQLQSKLHTVEKQFMNSREETIMKTNQFQNNEVNLKDKMEELLQNLQRMRQIYENRQKELKKQVDRYGWQMGNKNEQVEKLKQIHVNLSEQIKSLKENLRNRQVNETTLNREIQKLKIKLKEDEEEYLSLLDQHGALEQHSSKLQADIANHMAQVQELSVQKQNCQKHSQDLQKELQNYKQSLAELTTQKKSLKAIIFSLQSETQELKIIHSHCQQQIESYSKQKNEESNLVRTVMREKQNLLRQYLESQQKISLLENKEFEMNESIIQLSGNIDKIRKDHQEDKKSLNNLKGQVKTAELVNQQKQSFIKQVEQKYKNMERNKNQLEQTIQKIQIDWNKQKSQHQLFIRSKEIQLQEIKDEMSSKNIKLQQLQTKIIKEQKRYQQLNQQINRLKDNITNLNQQRQQNQQRLTEYIEKEAKTDIELFQYQTDIIKLKEDISRVQQELKERDLKNYELSSEIYRIQTESSNEIERLAQKITDQQISMLKYEQTCEQYLNRIDLLEKDNQSLIKAKDQLQEEYTKFKNKHNSLSNEYDIIQQKKSIIQAELQRVKETYKKLAISKDQQSRQHQQEIAKGQSHLQQKQLQFQKLKEKNETSKQLLQTMNQKINEKQRLLNEQIKKSMLHQQTSKKIQLQLRKAKQNWKQLHWNSQREVKKIIHQKILFFNNIQHNQDSTKLGDHLKSLQELILDVIKKYADS